MQNLSDREYQQSLKNQQLKKLTSNYTPAGLNELKM